MEFIKKNIAYIIIGIVLVVFASMSNFGCDSAYNTLKRYVKSETSKLEEENKKLLDANKTLASDNAKIEKEIAELAKKNAQLEQKSDSLKTVITVLKEKSKINKENYDKEINRVRNMSNDERLRFLAKFYGWK